MDLLKIFDKYNLTARIFPALILILPLLFSVYASFPVLFSVYASFPVLVSSDILLSLMTIFVSFGALYFLSNLCRGLGKKEEKILIEEWGGLPTTLILRHSDNTLNDSTKKCYHSFLAQQVPDIGDFPTASEETQNLHQADNIYSSSIDWLREQRRDKEKYYLLHEKNIQYGFRRNLLGVRVTGIILSVASILLILVSKVDFIQLSSKLIETLESAMMGVTIFQYMALFFNFIAFLCWIFVVNKNWVKEAGFQYANTLLKSIDQA